MDNLKSIFAAYAVVWAVFFLFQVSLVLRMSNLRGELDRLKETLKQGRAHE